MQSTPRFHQNPTSAVAHASEALTSLHRLLADLDRQRDTVREAIEKVTATFIPPTPIPQRPKRKKEEPELTGMLSRYPVHPKGEKLERANNDNDDDDDYDLSGIMVDFAGTSTWPARVRAVAQVAHLAGKGLRVSAVAQVILDQSEMDTSVTAAGHHVSKALCHHDEYERTGYGAYVYVPPDDAPPPSSPDLRNLKSLSQLGDLHRGQTRGGVF